MKNNNLYIDIRRSDEVLTKRFNDIKMNNFYSIPANHIKFNRIKILDHLEYYENIYLVCATSNRSQMIKDKYFSNDNRIIVNKNISFSKFPNKKGEHIIKLDNDKFDKIWITGTFKFNLYNITRIMQLILGIIMLLCGIVIINIKQVPIIIKIILLFMGIILLYSGITSNCMMGRMLKNYLN